MDYTPAGYCDLVYYLLSRRRRRKRSTQATDQRLSDTAVLPVRAPISGSPGPSFYLLEGHANSVSTRDNDPSSLSIRSDSRSSRSLNGVTRYDLPS